MARFTPDQGLKAIIYQFALLYIYNQDWKATEDPRKPYPKSVRCYFYIFSKYLLGMNPKLPVRHYWAHSWQSHWARGKTVLGCSLKICQAARIICFNKLKFDIEYKNIGQMSVLKKYLKIVISLILQIYVKKSK